MSASAPADGRKTASPGQTASDIADAPLHRRPGSLGQTVSAVLWGFLGVRRGSDYQRDIARLNPLHLVAVGVLMAFLFVALLIGLVNWVAG